MTDMVLQIDGKEVTVPAGTTVLQAEIGRASCRERVSIAV